MSDLPQTLSGVADEAIRNALPEFPITSVRRLQMLYGTLYNLGRGLTNVSGYGIYLTPEKADKSHAVVEVMVDLTSTEPTFERVRTSEYTAELSSELGHAYNTATRGHDHSLTHRSASGGSTLAKWTVGGFTGWPDPDDPAVSTVLNDGTGHPDQFIIERLFELGEKETVMSSIREQVESLDISSEAYLTTVRMQVDTTALSEPPAHDAGTSNGYLPGELPVCNEVMKQRVLMDYAYMKTDEIFSEGQGVDMATGTTGRVVGFADDPLKHFTTKQREKFRNLDRSRSWQSHPTGEEAAKLISASSEFLDACHTSRYFARIYQLPYFTGTPTVDQAKFLYSLLRERQQTDHRKKSTVELVQGSAATENITLDTSKLRFWTIAQYYQQEGRRDVFRETPAARVHHLEDLAQQHDEIVCGPLYRPGGFPTYDDSNDDDDWSIINPENTQTIHQFVASGRYFDQTFPRRQTDDDTDPKTTDVRLIAYFEAASGGTLNFEMVLSAYVERIKQELEDGDLPWRTISAQVAQLEALRRADLVVDPTLNNTESIHTNMTNTDQSTEESVTDTKESNNDDQSLLAGARTQQKPSDADKAAYRRYRLDQQLNRDVLSQSERKFVFGVGVLTGYISNYQGGREGMNRTIATQYGPEKMTIDRLKQLWVSLVEKATHYGTHGMLYRDSFARVESLQTEIDFEQWELSGADTRFQYASGLVFGANHSQSDVEADIADSTSSRSDA